MICMTFCKKFIFNIYLIVKPFMCKTVQQFTFCHASVIFFYIIKNTQLELTANFGYENIKTLL